MLQEFQIGNMIAFIVCGMVCAVVYNIFNLIKKLAKNNLLTIIVVDLFVSLLCGLIFILSLLKYKNGQFEWFDIVFFCSGIVFLQIFIKNLFARPISLLYNKITLRKENLKNEH